MRFVKKAIQDILANGFLNCITMLTIAFSVLMVSMFSLFVLNAECIAETWTQGIRIMAYLKPGTSTAAIRQMKQTIERMKGVRDVRFISKEDALERLKTQMKNQSSLFENLKENPLPDAFEIYLHDSFRNLDRVETIAKEMEAIPQIEEIEYGQIWFKRFSTALSLFRLGVWGMGGLFFMAALFFVANTTRLVLYSRRQEVEILRIVGATDTFIKTPFYIQSLIQGVVGGVVGLAGLAVIYRVMVSHVEQSSLAGIVQLRFLSWGSMMLILIGCMAIGWTGCWLSLRHYLKY